MSDVKITVGGTVEDAATRRFVDAWHRAEQGETFRELPGNERRHQRRFDFGEPTSA